MIDAITLGFLGKMVATAAVVVLAAAAVERSGPFLGAMITTLPLSAGPAFVFLAIEYGPEFLARSAVGGLAGNAATAIFIVVYCHLAQRVSLVPSLLVALTVWGFAAWGIGTFAVGRAELVAVNVVVFAFALAATRTFRRRDRTARVTRRWWDVPVRCAGVMALVSAVLLAGYLLGPRASGALAMAPIVMTSLMVILQTRLGGEAAADMLAHTLPGMVGFGVALTLLGLAAVPFGSLAAILLLLATSITWNLGLGILRHRGRTVAARTATQAPAHD